ncbi:hypothetical protein MSG28_004897, partial [Choristoneura fumiferana]
MFRLAPFTCSLPSASLYRLSARNKDSDQLRNPFVWKFGIKCPVCSKFVLPDDIECHLVMCLTRPRLSYN